MIARRFDRSTAPAATMHAALGADAGLRALVGRLDDIVDSGRAMAPPRADLANFLCNR